jgi:hypothetical protein
MSSFYLRGRSRFIELFVHSQNNFEGHPNMSFKRHKTEWKLMVTVVRIKRVKNAIHRKYSQNFTLSSKLSSHLTLDKQTDFLSETVWVCLNAETVSLALHNIKTDNLIAKHPLRISGWRYECLAQLRVL